MTINPTSPPRHGDFGTLRLQVTTAQGTFPVDRAQIEVRTQDGTTALYRAQTDQNGIADELPLPANPREASLHAATAPGSARIYSVTVSHASFYSQQHPVSIFSGIKTILPVVLVPRLLAERRAP